MRTSLLLTLALLALLALPPQSAHAFCGFYVGGGGAELYNSATLVALMRDGERTVLSMQNNYQGPPENFAMVVPVPVVLSEDNVRTLPREVFDRLDRLAAPRLVEYWEQDPCVPARPERSLRRMRGAAPTGRASAEAEADDLGVTVEAQFTVGEYDIVILSAENSSGLDTWLRQEGYQIPAGAEPVLRPYVESGMKFFVAKVDIKKVQLINGRAMLSPLRFHYDSPTFSLPVRLGLLNSAGTQDLIVHILARGQRYEVANYPNVTIPTNLDLAEQAQQQFGAFYVTLFDEVISKNQRAVVTEYSWDAGTCDPCPSPAMNPSELATLGADVLPGGGSQAGFQGRGRRIWPSGFVLTRLHARYQKGGLGEDLVFRAAPPISGGREVRVANGELEHGSQAASVNNFQARYAIRHPWTGPVACDNPRREIWGGPPAGVTRPETRAALDLANAPRGALQLPALLKKDIPELGIRAAAAATGDGKKGSGSDSTGSPVAPTPPITGVQPAVPATAPTTPGGCGQCGVGRSHAAWAWSGTVVLALAGLTFLRRRRGRGA